MLSCNKLFLFIINLRILSFSQVRFSLRPIQFFKHLGLPQPLPTPPTNSTTILLSNFTGKESASLEYLTDIIFNPYHEQVVFTPSQVTFSLRSRLVCPGWRCHSISPPHPLILQVSPALITTATLPHWQGLASLKYPIDIPFNVVD